MSPTSKFVLELRQPELARVRFASAKRLLSRDVGIGVASRRHVACTFVARMVVMVSLFHPETDEPTHG